MEDKKGLLLLFQRPLEPVFVPKDDGKTAFDLPNNYLTERYKDVGTEIASRFGDDVGTKIPLRNIKQPDLSFAKPLSRKQQFSLFIDSHKRIAAKLIEIFMQAKDVATFLAIAAYARDRVNPTMFQYALSVAIQHRPDTKDLQIPNILEIFPLLFVDPSVINQAREEGSVFRDNGNRMRIEIAENYTASDREDEQKVAYWREDIGINIHHWHWHLVYPTEGPIEIVRKDRRGELFFFMHHQIMARYNVERFCNGLGRVRPLSNLREPIGEAYFPKILSSLNNRTYTGRIAGIALRDINRGDNTVEVADMERWRDRIYEAIDQGYVVSSDGTRIPLDIVKGIDVLGDIIEASVLSPNRQLYGNLHNMGHNIISFIHDPDNRHLEDFGVIGDVTTSMRDPAFYRWHIFIDNMFLRYKNTLPPYTRQDLAFDGINVDSIEVKIAKGNAAPNVLLTYKQRSDVDLASGLDFGPQGNVYATFTHLQRAPFMWNIRVTNSAGAPRRGTCRIFICPRVDDRGMGFNYNDAKNLMVEMDKFPVDLKPGQNIIRRSSEQSAITVPFERTFTRQQQPTDQTALAEFRYCGCGWPAHLLLPRGTAAGTLFDVFVMISDFAGDEVVQTNMTVDQCNQAHSFCGLKDQLYPDKRSMGYPFDRRFTADNITAFANGFSNMGLSELTVKFNDIVIEREN